jgi:hypothetical protein
LAFSLPPILLVDSVLIKDEYVAGHQQGPDVCELNFADMFRFCFAAMTETRFGTFGWLKPSVRIKENYPRKNTPPRNVLFD